MSLKDRIGDELTSLLERFRPSFAVKVFIYIIIILVLLGTLWVATTNRGWIARDSFMKTFATDRERVVTVYSEDGTVIRQFYGTYNVEFFDDDYIVVMNQRTGERVNVYGQGSIIIDEDPVHDHLPPEEKEG